MEHQSLKVPAGLFNEVFFYLANIEGSEAEKVKQMLKDGGAQREFYLTSLVTHVISDTTDFQKYREARDADLDIVTPNWVTMSVKCGIVLPCKPFSPEQDELFSGIVACPSQIQKEDSDKIWAMISYFGGQWETKFTSKCTHLIVGRPKGKKFEKALEIANSIKIVTPEWVTDSVKDKKCKDENEYYPTSTPIQDSNATTEAKTGPNVKSPTRSQDANSRVGTPKMNDGVPSTLMSPITPSLKASNGKPADSATESCISGNETLGQLSRTSSDITDNELTSEPGVPRQKGFEVVPIKPYKQQDIDYTSKQSNNSIFEGIPLDFLSGYIITFVDYEKRLHSNTFKIWTSVVKKFQGKVEPYSKKTTHLMSINQSSPEYVKALADGKKIATAHWLNEILVKKKFFPPQNALHIPLPFDHGLPACKGMLMTISGYEGADRILVKNMIFVLGANYTGYMCRKHTHLICRNPKGEKYIKAKEWEITVTNGAWLTDMLQTGKVLSVSSSSRYTKLGEDDELALNEELVSDIMAAWKEDKISYSTPSQEKVTPPAEQSKKRKLSQEGMEGASITTEAITKKRKSDESSEPPKVLVLFTGLTGPAVHCFTQMVKKMKGEVAKNVRTCTHLIAPKITRTVKFLSAISICKHIVTPAWIEASYRAGSFLDETEFILNDPDSEESFGFKLRASLKKARARRVFEGLKFYVTSGIVPAPGPMREIVECAGGELSEITKEPETVRQFKENKAKNEKSYIITCEDDREIWESLMKEGYDVYSVELVLSGVMKQEIEWDMHRF